MRKRLTKGRSLSPNRGEGGGRRRSRRPNPASKTAASRAAPPAQLAAEEPGEREQQAADSVPIVGIGASAGGLEAFTQVLCALPSDTGVAFVLVQHLAPNHESMLTGLLSGSTSMPVREVQDGMRVEANHVYVIPPNANMGILNGRLHLVPRNDMPGPHMPIDFFLKSLAEEKKGKAIGVILSGTASDGAMGLRMIKSEGGITIAQDPKSAKYDGMPRAAVSAGVVDSLLTPQAIASELAEIGRHPYVIHAHPATAVELPEAEDHLSKIFFLMHSAGGVDFTYYKRATIRRRIKRRMVLQKIERLGDYVRFLGQNAAEIEELFQDILIHVTGFFRDPQTFEALKSTAFPKIMSQRSRDAPIRIWSPGCSTGEETYSIGIALREFLGEMTNSVSIQIFATDISQIAIDKARAGLYPESIAADVAPNRLQRFFARADGGYRVSKSIRDMCVFAKQDVTKDPPFSNLDLIVCRNLLIYLGSVLQERVVSIFHYALRPGGCLLLGNSETIGSYSNLFALADKKHKIYTRKQTLRRAVIDFLPAVAVDTVMRAQPRKRVVGIGPRTHLQTEVDRVIVDRYAPAGVVVNDSMEIVHFQGRTGRYLEPPPGDATLSILKMAREGLMLELRSAINLARKKGAPVRAEGLRVKQNGHMISVGIEVFPIELPSAERHFLILFSEGPKAKRTIPAAEQTISKRGRGKAASGSLRRLEQELMATREYLQSIIQDQEATNEELQSANEEILSSNEELQSTNEELETAKEELQSTNEELNTLNDELQTRNLEVNQANSDLTNLLASVSIPIIIVGNDLRIRRFTPMAEKYFNVIPGDVGRPIGDIKPNIDVTNLDHLIGEAIETISVKEIEVRDSKGHWFLLRLRPYRSTEQKIEGAVLTLMDINELKRQATEAGESVQRMLANMLREPLVLLDGDLRVKGANQSFRESFRLSPKVTETACIFEIGDGCLNVPPVRKLLEESLPSGDAVEEVVVEYDFPGIGRKAISINASRLDGRADGDSLTILSLQDLTKRGM